MSATTETVKVKFVPQVWVNDQAMEADPLGPTEFEVPITDVKGLEDDTYESDELRYHANAPEWVREWTGPFYIAIDDAPTTATEAGAERHDDGTCRHADDSCPALNPNDSQQPAAEQSPFPLPLRVCGFPRSASDVPWSVTDPNGVVIADLRTEEIANLFAEAVNEREELIAALHEIAAYDDEYANRHLAQTGKYTAFDEPGAVQTARTVLERVGGDRNDTGLLAQAALAGIRVVERVEKEKRSR